MKDTKKKVLYVRKASGETAVFSERRLRKSLERSGADDTTIDDVMHQMRDYLFEGISTRQIYRKAFDLLRKTASHTAARYKLKQAIIELGPTGMPFERIVSCLLEREGFKTELDVTVTGRCVEHELDVVAHNDRLKIMVECKFHNRPGYKSDIKVPLYIHSRYQDVKTDAGNPNKPVDRFDEAWLFTNTRFSEEAIQYGECAGLKLCSWDYPSTFALKDKLDLYRLYPVTCLTGITNREKKMLIEKDIVLCQEVSTRPDSLRHVGIGDKRRKKILDEITNLVNTGDDAYE